MGHARPILVYFCSFQTQILQKNTVGFGGIQIRIIGVEGEHADHLTTTKARMHFCLPISFFKNRLPISVPKSLLN